MTDPTTQELFQKVNTALNRCTLNEAAIAEARREHRAEKERNREQFSRLEGSVNTISTGQSTIISAIGEFNGGIKTLKWVLPLFGAVIVVAVSVTVYLITK